LLVVCTTTLFLLWFKLFFSFLSIKNERGKWNNIRFSFGLR
jgi:hypothetical protein